MGHFMPGWGTAYGNMIGYFISISNYTFQSFLLIIFKYDLKGIYLDALEA